MNDSKRLFSLVFIAMLLGGLLAGGPSLSEAEEPAPATAEKVPPAAAPGAADPEADEGEPEAGADGEAEAGGDAAPGSEGEIKPEDELTQSDTVAPAKKRSGPTPPGGMVYLEGGEVPIGTTPRELVALLEGRPPEQQRLFAHERPQHMRHIDPVWFGKYEVSNAQYDRFLMTTQLEYDTSSGGKITIDQISAEIWNMDEKERRNVKQKLWRLLYNANKQAIWDGFATDKKLEKLVKKRADGEVDDDATALSMRYEPLRRGTKLMYTSRRPPQHWEGIHPPAKLKGHPVRGVSYNDAEAFAEWAGMHVQTEFEFEYAARGAERNVWPWAGPWKLDASRANWGSKVVGANYEATTMPVDSLAAGASWCGVHHTVGNVAEWTMSWFEAYPGDNTEPTSRAGRYMGRSIKVIRGGSAPDLERLVLRPAYRNWEGESAKAPPYPNNSYPWVGFRVASYLEAGRDQLGPVVRRIVARRRIKESWLDIEAYRGQVTNSWVENEADAEHHVYVTGPSASVIFVPMTALLQEDGPLDIQELWKRPTRASKTSSLQKRSGDTTNPLFAIGALHLDVGLEGVEVRKPTSELTEDEVEKLEKARKRKRAIAPFTKSGSIDPGTYVLAYWHGLVCLADPSMDFVCFLPKYPGQKQQLTVEKIKPEDQQPGKLPIDEDLDEGNLRYQFALGGKKKKDDDKTRVVIDVALPFASGALSAAGNGVWRKNATADGQAVAAVPGAPPPAPVEEAPSDEKKPAD